MKNILWITTVVFFLLSWWWYVCPHKQVCPFGMVAAAPDAIEEEDQPPTQVKPIEIGPLTFDWSSDDPILSEEFDNYRDSILNLLEEDDILEILGGYFAKEVNTSSQGDLGLARAHKTRALFGDIPDSRVAIKGAQFRRDAGSEKNRPFLATNFRRIIRNESVREVDGKMIINFPHASDEMLTNAKLNEYLDDLVTNLKSNQDKVRLVGHTDSSAGAARNMRLGQMRANAIKNLLVRKGIDASRISTSSRGETSPIASNETEEGRQRNRRVELTVVP